MSKNSFWNSLGDAIGIIVFIKYILPIILIVIFVLVGIALNHKEKIASQVDRKNSILYTEFKNTIYNIAKDQVNKEELELSISDSDIYDVKLEYTVKNKEYSAEQYGNLLKQEITKVYNQIKDKELVNDTLFGKDEGLENVEIVFILNYNDSEICWEEIRYSLTDKWDNSYNITMEEVSVTQEKLDDIKTKDN